MMIELRRVEFVNKGAELMLYAILYKLKQAFPEAKFCMTTNSRNQPYEKRIEFGLYQKIYFWKKGIQFGTLGALIPHQFRKQYGLVIDSEVDVVIDAAGFAYSDQWGNNSCMELANSCKRWKRNGTKVILLPQAFGPFNHAGNQYYIKQAVENIDLLFAREQVSYDYVTNTVGVQNKIKLAPDFTNLLEGILPENFDRFNNRFCIVPNYRMIDKTSPEQSNAYVPLMIQCAKYLLEKDQKPFILVHEGKNDLMLANQINDAVGGKLPIIKESHPLKIKGILGACEGTIGSRFHGLVSALSQGVPSLATGWSHKYQMLFEDYNFGDGLLDILADEAEIHRKLDLLINTDSKTLIRQQLIQKSTELKLRSQLMWNEVIEMIKQ